MAYFDTSPTWGTWIKINQGATILAMLVGLSAAGIAFLKYVGDDSKYHEDRIAKAWDSLMRMSGKQSNGGQSSAISLLVAQKVPLDQVDLSQTYLAKANLSHGSFVGARLGGANLSASNLSYADFSRASLGKANLSDADLSGASFSDADLGGANLSGSTIDIAILGARNYRQTDVTGATFVFLNASGEQDWSMYSDTLAESPNADRFNDLCEDPTYRKAQDPRFPLKLNLKKCALPADYSRLRETQPPNGAVVRK